MPARTSIDVAAQLPPTPEAGALLPEVATAERIGSVTSALSAWPEALPAISTRLALGLVGTALPILGAAYMVRAGVQTVLGKPPQFLRALA